MSTLPTGRQRPIAALGLALVCSAWLATPTLALAELVVRNRPAVAKDPLGESYRAGLTALVAGKLDEAQTAFEAAAKADPRSPAPLLGLAEIAFKRKRLDDALARIKEALAVSPNDSTVHATMGRYLLVSGKPKEAEDSLRTAIQLDDRAIRPRIDLADHLSAQRRWAEAVPLYESCVAIDPQHAGAHYALGLAYAQVGQADKARAALASSAKLDPKNPLPHVAMARWHGGRKEFPKAQAAVTQALQRAPKLLDALLLRGDLFDASADTASALRAYGQAAEAHPASAAPHLRMAMLHHRSGAEAKALPLYLKVAELEPRNVVAMNNIADIHSKRQGGLDDAERWAMRAVAAAPKAADVQDTLGWIQRAKGKLPAARASLETAVRLNPQNGETLYRLAQVYADQGNHADARKALQAAQRAQVPLVSVQPARKLQAELGG